MINSIIRSIGSVLLSFIVAFALVVAVEGLSSILHPFPPGFGYTQDEMFTHVANYPVWVLALLGGAGWGATMLVATFLVTRFGAHRHPAHGIGVGIVLMAAVIFNMSMLPYPMWFIVLDVLMLPLCIYVGTRLGQGRPLMPKGSQ